MKKYWLNIICIIFIASCTNHTSDTKELSIPTISTPEITIDYDINQIHEVVLKQKLDDIWSLQLIESVYTDFKTENTIDKLQIVLEDSIQSIQIIEYIKPFVQDTFKLKTEITYHNRKKDTIQVLMTSKEIIIDQDTLISFEVSFKK